MKLFCPSCQKELTVEEKYAGQQMTCPLCQRAFVAPSATEFTTSAPDSPPEPPPKPPAKNKRKTDAELTKPKPDVSTDYPTTGHTKHLNILLKPQYIQWAPAGAMALVFLLCVFPWATWVSVHLGDVWLLSQNGWQSSLGLVSQNPKYAKAGVWKDVVDQGSGANLMMAFYFIVLVPASIVIAGAAAAVKFAPFELPPIIEPILPWKWAIATAVILVGFLFLFIHLCWGFNLENSIRNKAYNDYYGALKATDDNKLRNQAARAKGAAYESIHRTNVISFMFWLHLIALIAAGFMYWIDFRKNKPLPRIDVLW